MVVELCLSREENTPWGFRLVGGVEFDVPLTVVKVKQGSVAHSGGLCDGDIVTRIDSIPAHQLSHCEAQYVINEARNQIHLAVVRGRSNPLLLQKYIELEPEYELPDYNYTLQLESRQDYDQTDEVSDAELRSITASPFPASETKRYRPFSTEPVEGIPPLEDPIILSPYYQDDFSHIKKEDYEPETKFKLPKSPAALMFQSNCENQKNSGKNYYNGNYEEYMLNANLQSTITNGVENFNINSENYSTNALESERINVYEQIRALNQNYSAPNETQVNGEYLNQTSPLNVECTNEMSVKNVAKEVIQENLPKPFSATESIQDEFVTTSMEFKEVENKTELRETNQNPDMVITYVATVEHSERVIEPPKIIEQSQIILEETNIINKSTEISKTVQENKTTSPIVEANNIQKSAETSKEIEQEARETKSKEVNVTEQQNTQKQIDNFIDQSQIKEKLTESIAKHVNEKQTIESAETSIKTTKSVKEVKEEAVSIANLLTEQARATWLRSQTIPSLQYSVQSTYHYDLLLKTFFIHLTDVMVALSRLIMTETPNSRSSSPMPPDNAAQSTRQQVLEKILAQKATQTIDNTVHSTQRETVSQLAEQKSVSRNEELVNAKVASIAEVVSHVGTTEILAKKSEATLKIESLLGQKDPLEWLAEKDQGVTQTSATTTIPKEISENKSESSVKEEVLNSTEVVVQDNLKEEIKVVVQQDVKEDTKVVVQEAIKEEVNVVVQEDFNEETNVVQKELKEQTNIVVQEDFKEETNVVVQEDTKKEAKFVVQEEFKDETNVVQEEFKEETNVVQEDFKEETKTVVQEDINEEAKVLVDEELKTIEETTRSQEVSNVLQEEVILERTQELVSAEIIKVTEPQLIPKEVLNTETIISEEVLNTESISAENTQTISESNKVAHPEAVESANEVIVSENSALSTEINVTESVSQSEKAVKKESMIVEQTVKEESQSFESKLKSTEIIENSEKTIRDNVKLKSILKKAETSENVNCTNEIQEVQSSCLESDENNNLPTPVEIAPPTPLTDEYVFRLDVHVPGLKRSSSKSPEPNPEPEPQALHEDPNIVKKPRLKANIQIEIESVIYKPDCDNKDDGTVDCRSVESELVQEMLAKESTTEESVRTSATVKSTTEQMTASQQSATLSSQMQNGHAEVESADGISQPILNGSIQSEVDIMIHNATEEEVGKPGLSEETIAELMSGEAEMLKEAHVIGLKRVLSSHMTRVSEDDDENSSVNFKKLKPQIESLMDSEVLKVLNEEILQTKEEKKKEERKWTTFLQKPDRPVPKNGLSKWGQAYDELQGDYKVQIIKQPKPRVAPDAPKDYNTGPLPWEQRQANEPPPEPIQPEEPILVPEEGPEYLEALDTLPESAVPDLEDTGLELPPEPVVEEVAEPAKAEEAETGDGVEVISEVERLTESAEEEEMAQNKLAVEVLNNIQNMVDGELSVEEQLAQMHAQLSALAQLPAVIQQTLESVTKQLSKIVPQQNGQEQVPALSDAEHSEGNITEDEGQTTDAESLVVEELGQTEQPAQDGHDQLQNGEATENGSKHKILAPSSQEAQLDGEESKRIRQQEVVILDEQSRIEQQKKELISELELEHCQRQVKQRPTGRVGRPKPAFGPLTPQERPLVLPGGRRWRGPKDAFNEELIAETLAAQAEVIKGKAVGLPYESHRLPYDQRINFMKYEKPPKSLDHLKESSVYKLVHAMEEEPLRGVAGRPPLVLAESEFREKCRSVTPNLDGPKF